MGKKVFSIIMFAAMIFNCILSLSFDKKDLASITKETYPDDDAVIQTWERELKLSNMSKGGEYYLSPLVEEIDRRVIKILTDKGIEKYSVIKENFQNSQSSMPKESDFILSVSVLKSNGKIVKYKTEELRNIPTNGSRLVFTKQCSISSLEIGDSIYIETKKYFMAEYMLNDFILSSEHSVCHIMFKIFYPLDAEIDMITFNELNYKKFMSDKYVIWRLDNVPGTKNEILVLPESERTFHVGYGVRRFRWSGYSITLEIFDDNYNKHLNRSEIEFIEKYDDIKTVNDIEKLISHTMQFLNIDQRSPKTFTKSTRSLTNFSEKMSTDEKLVFIVYKVLKKNSINVKVAGLLPKNRTTSGKVKQKEDILKQIILVVDHFAQKMFFSFDPDNSFVLPYEFCNREYLYLNLPKHIQISRTPYFHRSSLKITTEYNYRNAFPQKKVMILTDGAWSQVLDGYLKGSQPLWRDEFKFFPKEAKYIWYNKSNVIDNKNEPFYISGDLTEDTTNQPNDILGNKQLFFDLTFINEILKEVEKKPRYNDYSLFFPSTMRFEQRIELLRSENLISYPKNTRISLFKNMEVIINNEIDDKEITTVLEMKIYSQLINKVHQEELIELFSTIKRILSEPVVIKNELKKK